MAQRVNTDQREFDGRVLKGFRVEHPSGNQPFLASFSDHTKMALPFIVFLPEDRGPLPEQRMIGVTDLNGQYAVSLFAGPAQVLAYLSRYTHRIAISNRQADRHR